MKQMACAVLGDCLDFQFVHIDVPSEPFAHFARQHPHRIFCHLKTGEGNTIRSHVALTDVVRVVRGVYFILPSFLIGASGKLGCRVEGISGEERKCQSSEDG